MKFATSVAVVMCWCVAFAVPSKVAVLTGSGAKGIAAARWVELVGTSPDITPVFLDGAAVRAGALKECALVVLPDGDCAAARADLGEEGAKQLRAFVLSGGACYGTGAGCALMLQQKGLGLLPFVDRGDRPRSATSLSMPLKEPAKKFLGLNPGGRGGWYNGGPVLDPGAPVPEAQVEVAATFKGDVNTFSAEAAKPMTGAACWVVGTYGKGRVVAMADTPEFRPGSHYVVARALDYLLGRKVTIGVPQRRVGQKVVGLYCEEPWGPVQAELCRKLYACGAVDVVSLSDDFAGDGEIRHVDEIVVPGGKTTPAMEALLVDFRARGGMVWTAEEAVHVWAPEKPVAAIKPAQVAIYADRGVSCAEYWNATRLISFSPNYRVTFMSGREMAEGGLKGFDLVFFGGGWNPSQVSALGEKGRAELEAFIRAGGAYYGICAGAFNVLKTSWGFAPYRSQKDVPYRGWSDIAIRFTKEGEAALGFKADSLRNVLYWGGPVMFPLETVADSDIHPFANYYGQTINTFSGGTVQPMAGFAAILGGRLGKGRIIASGPHPECSERTQDIVRAFLRYLTGRPADPIYPTRRPNALNVAISVESPNPGFMTFGMYLAHDDRFDLRPSTPYEVDAGLLDHSDVLLMAGPVGAGDYVGRVYDFLKRGGRVIEMDPKGETRMVSPGIFRAKTFDDAKKRLLEFQRAK